MCLILFQGSIVRSGLHSSLFFTVSMMWFLLVRFACMAILTGLWHRLSKSSMGSSQSFPSKRGGKARPWPGFHFMGQKRCMPGTNGASLVLRPPLESGMRLIQVARSLLVAVYLPVLLILGGRGAMGGQHHWCVAVLRLLIIFVCSFSG